MTSKRLTFKRTNAKSPNLGRRKKIKKAISVVVPCHQSATTIELCLMAIAAARKEYSGPVEVFAVLSQCNDQTPALIAKFPDVQTISCGLGRSQARNAGLQKSTGQYVFFVDSDTLVNQNFFTALATQLDAADGVVGVTCPILPSVPNSHFLFDITREMTGGETRGTFVSLFRAKQLGPFIDTAACAFKREALQKAGGFDETLYRQEDVDLSLRLHQKRGRFAWSKETFAIKIVNHPSWIRSMMHAFNCGFHRIKLNDKWISNQKMKKRLEPVLHWFAGEMSLVWSGSEPKKQKAFYALYSISGRLGNIAGLASGQPRKKVPPISNPIF